jgi:tripartite-type tricarboxylate transporter receptor subunit TctC
MCNRYCESMIAMRSLALLLLSLAIAAAAPATAHDWPSGTVRVIVPYSAGGPLDLPARLLIDRLAAQTKGTFILEHRAGAGGAVGAQAVMRRRPTATCSCSPPRRSRPCRP